MVILSQGTSYTRTFKMIDKNDHFSLRTLAGPVVNISKAGQTFAVAAGTVGTVGNGWYRVFLTNIDTNTIGDLAFYVTGTNSDDTDFVDQVSPIIFVSGGTVGSVTGSVGSVTGAVGSVTGEVGSVTTPVFVQGGTIGSISGVIFISGGTVGKVTGAVGSVTGNVGGDVVGNVQGNVTGSVGSVTGAVGSVSGAVNSVTIPVFVQGGTTGKVTTSVQTVLNYVTVGTNNDKTGYSLSAGQLFVKKNTALANFMFPMIDSADHVTLKTGLTVTGEVSIDGAAFGALTNSPAELASGVYKVDLAAADVNGTNIMLKFTATGGDTRLIELITQA